MDLFEEGYWRGAVRRIEQGLREGLEVLRGARGVVDVRVMGAIGVVEFEAAVDVGALCARFAELGAWIRPMGKVVYLTPGFVTSDEEVGVLTGAVRRGCG